MCGLLGWVGSDRPTFSPERFSFALDSLSHRGPDDKGIWARENAMLGHRRLSIIDLTHAGHQPMLCPLDRSVIVFNGEIYNYLEIKRALDDEGIPVSGGSDTGVLQAAISHWGVEIINKLNGMWAFASWNHERQELLMCRDRFGVKPLYYRMTSGSLGFSSEPKALLSLFPENRTINEPVLLEFLVNNNAHASESSFYAGINLFPAAHYGIYDARTNSLKLQRYWNYPTEVNRELASDDAESEFSGLLEKSVAIRMRSDVPVGLTLSGGLDSTAILAATINTTARSPLCFTSTYGPQRSGEYEWAKLAAGEAAQLKSISAVEADWFPILREISWHLDSPGYSPAVYPLWCLMKAARQMKVPVLLEGQGADEGLAGYPQYMALELVHWLRGRDKQRRDIRGLYARLAGITESVTAKWAFAWIGRELFPSLLKVHRARTGFNSLLRSNIKIPNRVNSVTLNNKLDSVKNRLLKDHSEAILPSLLQYGDAISMGNSIETRNPFLDYRLVDFIFKLPTNFLIRDGDSKWILRQYLRKNNQKDIGNRRDKKGYPTPVYEWMRGSARKQIEELVLGKNKYIHEWCDPKKIQNLIEMHDNGAIASGHHLYKLVSTQLWIDECINQDHR